MVHVVGRTGSPGALQTHVNVEDVGFLEQMSNGIGSFFGSILDSAGRVVAGEVAQQYPERAGQVGAADAGAKETALDEAGIFGLSTRQLVSGVGITLAVILGLVVLTKALK